MLPLEEFADLLAARVEGVHDGVGGNLTLNMLPTGVHEDDDIPQVGVFNSFNRSGFPSDYDGHSVQVRVRGNNIDDPLSGMELAYDIYTRMRRLGRSGLPSDGVLLQVIAAGPPFPIGYDENDRPEFVVNFLLDVLYPNTE